MSEVIEIGIVVVINIDEILKICNVVVVVQDFCEFRERLMMMRRRRGSCWRCGGDLLLAMMERLSEKIITCIYNIITIIIIPLIIITQILKHY